MSHIASKPSSKAPREAAPPAKPIKEAPPVEDKDLIDRATIAFVPPNGYIEGDKEQPISAKARAVVKANSDLARFLTANPLTRVTIMFVGRHYTVESIAIGGERVPDTLARQMASKLPFPVNPV